MTSETTAHPPIASREEWRKARVELLEREKAATRLKDKIAADRRRLPMVKIDKNYLFEGPNGKVSLRDLFSDKHQLIVYHFMFEPDAEKGCPGCTSYIDALAPVDMLKLLAFIESHNVRDGTAIEDPELTIFKIADAVLGADREHGEQGS